MRKTTQDRRRLLGLCPHCGKHKPKIYYKHCETCLIQMRAEGRARHRVYKKKDSESSRRQYQKMKLLNPERYQREQAWHRARYVELRHETLKHYGGVCRCCGESNPIFLTLDHIYNDGQAHRIQLTGRRYASPTYFRKLQQQGWPPILQVLCANCHLAKTKKMVCPHLERCAVGTPANRTYTDSIMAGEPHNNAPGGGSIMPRKKADGVSYVNQEYLDSVLRWRQKVNGQEAAS